MIITIFTRLKKPRLGLPISFACGSLFWIFDTERAGGTRCFFIVSILLLSRSPLNIISRSNIKSQLPYEVLSKMMKSTSNGVGFVSKIG